MHDVIQNHFYLFNYRQAPSQRASLQRQIYFIPCMSICTDDDNAQTVGKISPSRTSVSEELFILSIVLSTPC